MNWEKVKSKVKSFLDDYPVVGTIIISIAISVLIVVIVYYIGGNVDPKIIEECRGNAIKSRIESIEMSGHRYYIYHTSTGSAMTHDESCKCRKGRYE